MLAIRRTLVIAPRKVAESTWSAEAEKWEHLKDMRISIALGNREQRIRALEETADVYIINRENTQWLVDCYQQAWPFDVVVLDESSSFKSHRAKRFKAMCSVRPRISRMIELTGTPSPHGIMDLWSQVYLLDGGKGWAGPSHHTGRPFLSLTNAARCRSLHISSGRARRMKSTGLFLTFVSP